MKIQQAIAPHGPRQCAAVIEDDNGNRVGHVVHVGGGRYEAHRKHGQDGVDIRRYAGNFRGANAAANWVAKGHA